MFGGLFVAFCAVAAISAMPASAAYLHNTVIGEYGKEGPKASGTDGGCNVEFHDASDRIYYFADDKIYGLQRTAPGTVTPLAGAFPIAAGVNSSCGDRDLAVDNTGLASGGNIYAVPSNTNIYGWSAGGVALSGFPANAGGETCGVATTNNGQVWGGTYGSSSVTKFNAAGVSVGSLSLGFTSCKIAIDPSNNDLYVQPYDGGAPLWKYTAASNYATKVAFPSTGTNNPGIAINGTTGRIYVANGTSTVNSYDTSTGGLVEEISPGGGVNSVAVDETTDTLFVAPTDGAIKEISGVIVPDVVTGDPVGNTAVSGTIDGAGGGAITECYFEFGETTGYELGKEDCSPAPPFSENPQGVTADLPGLEGEVLYHYRLVAHNANGKNFGADKTVEPHNVKALTTNPATNITRTMARLNASFEGTGEDTTYYFEWEQNTTDTAGSCPCANSTPLQDAGVTNVPTSIFADLTGLTAGKRYRFRVVAENDLGVSKALTREFTTSPAVTSLTTQPATDVDTESATLNGSLDPDGLATTYYFEWGKDDTYGQATPLPPGNSVGDSSPGVKSVNAPITNLEPGTEYHYRIVGVNSTGETVGSDQTFTTPQPPSINSFAATNITATSADLIATINPNNSDTTYYFEYGTTLNYGQRAPIPDGTIPAGDSVVERTESIGGLTETTYHFRLVATNDWGTVVSEDQAFDFAAPEGCPNHNLRQQTGAAYLPDCRAYELVSAARAGGAVLFPEGPISPYASGRFGYAGWVTAIPGAGEPQNGDLNFKDLYFATRHNDGWTSKYVGVPGSKGLLSSSAPACEYGGCQSLSYGPWGVNYPSAVPGDMTLEHILIWDRRGMTLLNQPFPSEGTNAPLVFDNEGRQVAQLPTNVGEVPGADKDLVDGGWIGSARISPDYSNYAFSSIRTAFAPGGLEQEPGSVYDNDIQAGTVTVVSKTEDGQDIPQDLDAGRPVEFIRIPAVSNDGSHILMAAPAPPFEFFKFAPKLSHLYLAANNGDGTYEHYDISVDKDGDNVGVLFEGMSSDGSKVYLTTDEQMTADDTDTSIDLYVWEESTNSLTRASDSGNLPGNSDSCAAAWTAQCNVETIPQVLDDFEDEGTTFSDSEIALDSGDFYFYSPEQLDGARGFPGKRNLYVYRDGHPQYVTSLDSSNPVDRINVSPDGSFMGMITRTQLTPYDTAGHSMMYVYDAEARTIKCVACLPNGDPPAFDVRGSTNGWFMAFDGRAFWSTRDPLVPQDANNAMDVYEFVNGRPQLISTGTGKEAVNNFQKLGLVHVTGDGVDVFFGTFDTLVPQDQNGDQYKFYTARTNGGIPAPVEKPPCAAADECHGEDTSAPPLPEIGSGAGLGGNGNHNFRAKKKRCAKKGRAKKRCRSRRARQRARKQRRSAHRGRRHG